jgi:hypothetical protein
MWKIQGKKRSEKKDFDCSKSRYIQRNIFSMHVRFSIHVFSNSRATSKKVNKPHTKKLKTKLLASKVEILREQTLQMIVTAPPLFNRDLSTLQTTRYMCRKKKRD